MKAAQLIDYMDSIYRHPKAPDGDMGAINRDAKRDVRRIFLVYDPSVINRLSLLSEKPDLIISHHPFSDTREHNNTKRDILERKIALAWYHNVMDAHMTIGHNILLANKIGERFGIKHLCPAVERNGFYIGYEAFLEPAVDTHQIAAYLEEELWAKAGTSYLDAPDRFSRRFCVVSGGYANYVIDDCLSEGIDTLICGETNKGDIMRNLMYKLSTNYESDPESVSIMAEETLRRLKILDLGHQETELIGLEALKEVLHPYLFKHGARRTDIYVMRNS